MGSLALLREEETNSREESYGRARLESWLVAAGFDGRYDDRRWMAFGTSKNHDLKFT
jgi:hypothetical protein